MNLYVHAVPMAVMVGGFLLAEITQSIGGNDIARWLEAGTFAAFAFYLVAKSIPEIVKQHAETHEKAITKLTEVHDVAVEKITASHERAVALLCSEWKETRQKMETRAEEFEKILLRYYEQSNKHQ